MVMMRVLCTHKRHWEITVANTSWNTRWRDKGKRDDLIARLEQLSFVFQHIRLNERYRETCSDCVLDRKCLHPSLLLSFKSQSFGGEIWVPEAADSARLHFSLRSTYQLLTLGCLVTKGDEQTEFIVSLKIFIFLTSLFLSLFHLLFSPPLPQ